MINNEIQNKINEICEKYGIKKYVFNGSSRQAWVVKARIEAVVYLREEMKLSYPHIGNIINRHHTNVMHLYKKYLTEKKVA